MIENQELQVTTAESLSSIQRAEQESQVDIAKRYPRDVQVIKKRLLDYAGVDKETAADCFFTKPVGKDEAGNEAFAEGPSIRLAEIISAIYQNIRYGSRIIEETDRWVKVQGFAMDVENNIAFAVEEQRSIVTKKGYRYSENMIQNTIKAAAAIAIRNAIFKVVPPALFSREIATIKKIASEEINPDGSKTRVPIGERAMKSIEVFGKLGVTEERVLSTIGVTRVEEISEEHLTRLVGLHTAIREKEITIDEAFPPTVKEEKQEKAKDAVGKSKDMFDDKKK